MARGHDAVWSAVQLYRHDQCDSRRNEQQALSEAQEGIKLDNRNADVHYLAGNAFNQLGGITPDAGTRASLFQNAVTSYQRAIELDPRKDEALTNLATVYYQNGQLDDAQKRIEQALAINPTDATSHYVLGTIFLQRSPGTAGETTDKAAKEFEAAIKSDPNFSDFSTMNGGASWMVSPP